MMTLPVSPQQAADELLKRRQARRWIRPFTEYTKPDYEVNWHHDVLCSYLDKFIARAIKRLIVCMPPRHGKSELVSRRLPALLLGKYPNDGIIACSYGADLASRMNRDVQRIIDSPEYARLFPETKLFGSNARSVAHGTYLRNSDVFEIVGHQGFYKSSGIGGAITGMGCQWGIIDDPLKNREEADSPVVRQAQWEFYTDVFYTRLEKDASILVTMTRWHEDDLVGRLLQTANDPNADQWTIIRFPAVAEPDGALLEDHRAEGEALWPNKYPLERLSKIESTLGVYGWAGLYQQRPSPRGGGMFQRHWFEIVGAAPAEATRVRYWDKAGTAGGGAYTAGVLVAYANGIFYIEDVIRGQWGAGEREARIKQTAQDDAERYGHVTIWVEQEPGSGGKESAENTIRNLTGYSIYAERVSGDKATRAEPFEAQARAGNVKLVKGTWNAAYFGEVESFPKGKYKDQVDATSGAVNKLALRRDVLWGYG